MYKLIIADDEPKIRRGLKKSLDWQEYNIELVGEAGDGEIAFNLAKEKHPDIMLLDICMPFLNGLELIKKLNEEVKDCVIVIITGYDEFEYMQEAIKLRVFDYLLKPVTKDNLKATIKKAADEVYKIHMNNMYFKWANKKIDDNMDMVKEKFFNDLIKGILTKEQIDTELNFLKIKFSDIIGVMLIKIVVKSNIAIVSNKNWDKSSLTFAIKNIALENFKKDHFSIAFSDEHENIIIVSDVLNKAEWEKTCISIVKNIVKYLNCEVLQEQEVSDNIVNLKNVYDKLVKKINDEGKVKPIALLILKYIENNYYRTDLSLKNVANNFNITPSYLSKLLKSETGKSFIDHLTSLRIQKAISIMSDPTVKIYEVAELVGYNNQYYFSKAFKKVTGLSPAQYREGNVS